MINAGANLDVTQPLLTMTEQKRGQASQQCNPAQGDQTRPVAANEHPGVQHAPPSDQMQGTIPLCHQADHDYTHLAEGIALAALTAWHEQSCLTIWWLLSSTIMVVLNAVSLALNINSMDGYATDQWRLEHMISAVVLCGYFGILSGQIYGMCLVRSMQLFAVHNKFAAPYYAGSMDLRSKVKACRALGYVMFVFSAITGVLWLILGMLEHDISRHVGMFILGLWHACHATISLAVAIKANDVKRMLDPVSSGMVTL